MSRISILWIVWIAMTLVGTSAVAAWMFLGGNREDLLIGQTTGAHHQLEIACETCHAAEPFSTPKKTLKAMNKTCVGCHKEELKASNDSHPIKKFKSPRMADYWAKIDARMCTSCHVEHKPEITHPGAVTLAQDFCVACHSEGEQDVRKNRPSHAGLAFNTCATSGCHNFHDNTALYEDFLVKHAGQPWLKTAVDGSHPALELAATYRTTGIGADLQKDIEKWLTAKQAVAPEQYLTAAAVEDWAQSGHAEAGLNCAGCHAPDLAESAPLAEIEAAWVEQPDLAVCASCHDDQMKTFRIGRHGMRRHPKIAKPRDLDERLAALGLADSGEDLPEMIRAWLADPSPPANMTVAEALIPMHPDAHGEVLSCSSCHSEHKADRTFAAVEACASCHADQHTAAYFDSPHHELWKAELSGAAAPGTGVTCATCHMPKFQQGDRIVTLHNQNDVLRPNEKMIRPVCMSCHGLEFAIDALADPDLVLQNFTGRPAAHIESIDWATRRVEEGDQGSNQ